MTFEESSEELSELLQLDINAKQIERLCHHYGEKIGHLDWKQAYNDGIQMRIPFKNTVKYVMMDGSMILTREKEQAWKEVKLGRIFEASDRIEGVSKNRNLLGKSKYIAHLGKSEVFFDKLLEILPTQNEKEMVFICDGSKWIWKWVDEYFPQSVQILDFYHCKEHIYAFAKIYFKTDAQKTKTWVEHCMDLLLSQQIKEFFDKLTSLPCPKKTELAAKLQLLKYLQNNEKRINYGLFKEKGY